MLEQLFGSKCLPDNVDTSEPNVDSLDGNVDSLEPKPAEAKFKAGDIAVVRGFKHPLLKSDGAIVTILSYHEKGNFYSCAIAPNVGIDVDAKYLEHYLPQENVDCDNHIAAPGKMVDALIKDGFSKERRLNIAAMAMQGLLANPHQQMIDMSIDDTVMLAVSAADALIAECEKK